MEETHTGKNLAKVVREVLMQTLKQTTDCLLCLLTDSAANMLACAEELKLPHISCFPHDVHNLIQYGTGQRKKSPAGCKILKVYIAQAKSVAAYFRHSSNAMVSLKRHNNGKECGRPDNPGATRWTGTYKNLTRCSINYASLL